MSTRIDRDGLSGTKNQASDVESTIDPETGEVLAPDLGPQDLGPAPSIEDHLARDTVKGERTITSVNRARALQSHFKNALALITIFGIGGVALASYYASHPWQSEQSAASKAAQSGAAGESRLPPLGRVDPPKPATASALAPTQSDLFGPAPPPPQSPQPALASGTGAPQTPPPKTQEQLDLERKLNSPVLMFPSHDDPRYAMSFGGQGQYGAAQPTSPMSPMSPIAPNITALLGGMQERSVTTDVYATRGDQESFGRRLEPTPTPAVTARVLPTRTLLLPKGAFIDCTLETAIDSTFDGMVTCVGATDVFSEDGRVVLLERGTKYVGEKRGDIKQGQARIFVLWEEARTPTGVVVNLASPGTDQLGRSGLPGYVDTHFWDRFGAALLISFVDGTLQAIGSNGRSGNGGNGGNAIVINPQGSRDVMTEVLKNTVAIPPTVVKNQGDRVQIFVARDVDFRSVYTLRSDGDRDGQ